MTICTAEQFTAHLGGLWRVRKMYMPNERDAFEVYYGDVRMFTFQRDDYTKEWAAASFACEEVRPLCNGVFARLMAFREEQKRLWAEKDVLRRKELDEYWREQEREKSRTTLERLAKLGLVIDGEGDS